MQAARLRRAPDDDVSPCRPPRLGRGWSWHARRSTIVTGYGRWLDWLDAHGLFDPAALPEARVSRERVSAYAAELKATVAPFSVATRIQQLGDALRAMAPDGDWGWILRGAGRSRSQAACVRDKLPRMQTPDRPTELGLQIMADADAATGMRPWWRAADYRDGLIIALLAHRPQHRHGRAGRHDPGAPGGETVHPGTASRHA